MIQVVGLEKSYGTQLLFKDVTFTLGKGERVGLVGRNGTGKSTLFKILLGDESQDKGDVIFPRNYLVGTLKQHLVFTKSTILEEHARQILRDSLGEEGYRRVTGQMP